MKLYSVLLLLLLFVTACSSLPATRPPFAARVSATVNPEQHILHWEVEANAPLVSAQLLFGADGGRAPLDIPVANGAQAVGYDLPIPSDGLRLPRGVNALRYAWTLRAASGDTVRLTQAVTSTLFVADDAPVVLNWQEAREGNISLFYLPDTPAARDHDWLLPLARDSMARAALALDTPLTHRIAIYLPPRVFWQGGAAFGDRVIVISYADRAYTGVAPRDYFTHEGAHALTQAWGNIASAGGMLGEGIAVYATGGHYRPDLLDQSAAALASSPLFIAPAILRRDFSNLQHEIAYTESGSFVKYLIEQYGLDKFRALVRRPNDWRAQYGKEYDALAQEWLTQLHDVAGVQLLPQQQSEVRRWQLKVRYYDVLRRYEERFDPDARRLPSVPIEQWDALLRRALSAPADAEDNRVLELLLVSAINAIETTRSDEQLALAERLLDEIEHKVTAPSSDDGALMSDARAIVRVAQAQDDAMLGRDWDALRATLDAEAYPQFAAQVVAQAEAQPTWLRYTQSSAQLTLAGAQAWLTVAQWREPLDPRGLGFLAGVGQRWVLALRKVDGMWRVTGRWPETNEVPMAR
ncbi:MAG: hypothetical protein ABI874_01855 [Chloroflexota bacterium]